MRTFRRFFAEKGRKGGGAGFSSVCGRRAGGVRAQAERKSRSERRGLEGGESGTACVRGACSPGEDGFFVGMKRRGRLSCGAAGGRGADNLRGTRGAIIGGETLRYWPSLCVAIWATALQFVFPLVFRCPRLSQQLPALFLGPDHEEMGRNNGTGEVSSREGAPGRSSWAAGAAENSAGGAGRNGRAGRREKFFSRPEPIIMPHRGRSGKSWSW